MINRVRAFMVQPALLGVLAGLAAGGALTACSTGEGRGGAEASPSLSTSDGGGSGTVGGHGSSPSRAGVTTTSASAGVPRTIESGGVIRGVEPWTFGGASGQRVLTDRFDLYITEKDPMIAQRLPGFLEAALDHYTRALGGLPAPRERLQTFVMSSHAEWKRLVASMAPSARGAASNIQRGGLTVGGRAYLFDIGSGDTMSLASHEGWHQYTQRTFAEPLPVWLEEGIAAYMEGHRWQGDSVTFAGWANVERFDQLRKACAAKAVLSLPELLSASPNQLVEHGTSGEALTYYAQAWALVHFLREGAGGKYRGQFELLLSDAAAGRMSQAVALDLSHRGIRSTGLLASRTGPVVFQAYFGAELGTIDAEYRAFVQKVVATGARSDVVVGASPLGGEY